MFILFIPLSLLLTGPFIQVILLFRKKRNKLNMSILAITVWMIGLEALLSPLSTIISMYGFSLAGIKCLTGAIGAAMIGFMIAATVIPLIGIIGYLTSGIFKKPSIS